MNDPNTAIRPSRRLRRSAALTLAAGGLLLLGACGGDDEAADDTTEESEGGGGEPAGGGDAVESITMAGFAFDPEAATIEAGAEISVANEDDATHNLTSDAFETGDISGGEEGSFTAPAEPGEFEIRCTIHPQMTGTVTVA
jgi:plastocyanin